MINWRVFKNPKPDDALEAIRLGREQLDAIAAEDARRKKDTSGNNFTLRRRKVPGTQAEGGHNVTM